jgi:hypothetical protein
MKNAEAAQASPVAGSISPSLKSPEQKQDGILGRSILEVMQNMKLSSLQASIYTRSAIVARLGDELTGAASTKKIQEFFVNVLQELGCNASGLVLIQDASMCLFLESTSDEFTEFCAALKSFTGLVDVKLIASCDDNSNRLMQSLYFKKVSISKVVDPADADVQQLAVDVFSNLVALCRRLGAMEPVQIIRNRSKFMNLRITYRQI